MCTMPTHYELFNVPSTADDVTVKRAYYKLAPVNHPDKTIHVDLAERSRREKLFKDANTAFEILSDALKRAAYDRGLRARAWV
jgi:DnaJ-class molecular chaperone